MAMPDFDPLGDIREVCLLSAVDQLRPSSRRDPAFGGQQSLEDIEAHLLPSATAALDELAWWGKATMTARAQA
jgi:hypothetical protein